MVSKTGTPARCELIRTASLAESSGVPPCVFHWLRDMDVRCRAAFDGWHAFRRVDCESHSEKVQDQMTYIFWDRSIPTISAPVASSSFAHQDHGYRNAHGPRHVADDRRSGANSYGRS